MKQQMIQVYDTYEFKRKKNKLFVNYEAFATTSYMKWFLLDPIKKAKRSFPVDLTTRRISALKRNS